MVTPNPLSRVTSNLVYIGNNNNKNLWHKFLLNTGIYDNLFFNERKKK